MNPRPLRAHAKKVLSLANRSRATEPVFFIGSVRKEEKTRRNIAAERKFVQKEGIVQDRLRRELSPRKGRDVVRIQAKCSRVRLKGCSSARCVQMFIRGCWVVGSASRDRRSEHAQSQVPPRQLKRRIVEHRHIQRTTLHDPQHIHPLDQTHFCAHSNATAGSGNIKYTYTYTTQELRQNGRQSFIEEGQRFHRLPQCLTNALPRGTLC
jgi:hypothetical protein